MSGILFNITTAAGRELHDVRVHGSGGELGGGSAHLIGTPHEHRRGPAALGTLEAWIRFANKGLPLPCYEPRPGCVKIYIGTCKGAESEEAIEVVSIVGAQVQLARVK